MDEIIKELAKKYGLTQAVIRSIVESPSRFIHDEMEKNTWKNFYLEGLGKIVIKRKYEDNVEELYAERLEKLNQARENRKYSRRLEKPNLGQSPSREDSKD